MRNLIRATAVAVVLLSSSACTGLDDTMVFIFGRSMRDQASFDPYENPLPPAEGSVPFAAGNYTPSPGAVYYGTPDPIDYDVPNFTMAATAQFSPLLDELENPFAEGGADLERGEELYLRTCAPCHAASGIGAEANLVPVWPALPAYNLAGEQVQGYSDGYIYGMIRVGRGMMPAYGHQVSHFDRWNIVSYVRQLQAEYNASQGAAEGGN